MTAPDNRLGYLYRQYVNKSCTPEEMQEFFGYVRDPAYKQTLEAMAEEHLEMLQVPAGLPAIDWEHMYRSVVPSGDLSRPSSIGREVDTSADNGRNRKGRVASLFTWSRVAAAVMIIVLCGGGYLFLTRRPHRSPEGTIAKKDITPGYDKAILTLSNGATITLDSAHTGLLTQQGNAAVVNSNSGRLTYNILHEKLTTVLYNTLTTPRGGQYQLTLPDGTKVWLNAASSLIYPTAFSGDERTVQMTGEVYFEVAHDKKRPFKVKVGGQLIEDIGTHFNVNAYTDESVQTTTLLEGAVRVGGHVLKPSEKASIDASGTIHVSKGDPEQAIAWKNGLFDFTDNDLQTVMRQLARWYNVDIKYEGDIPERQFTGMIGRSLTLTQVLKGLTRESVHYRIEEGNHLIITP
jgi:ferric-dicitrate binding protein FerR (iron transport regulator)